MSSSIYSSRQSLKKQYCPPLDEALFFALAGDYDLQDENQVAELRAALDGLKEGAVEEQELELLPVPEHQPIDLDPNSLSGLEHRTKPEISSEQTSSHPRSTTEEDGATSATTGFSGLALSEGTSDWHEHELSGYGETGKAMEDLSDENKVEWLMTMFPDVSKQNIEQVLARCRGNFDRSTDELLNLSFLRDDEHHFDISQKPAVKGIEGFVVSDNEGQVRRKAKSRKNRRGNGVNLDDAVWQSDSGHTSGTATPDPNVWASSSKDTEFIASRTSLKSKTIASVYHANGARLAPTIRALVTKEGEPYLLAPDKIEDLIIWQMEELKIDFEGVPNFQIYGALILADKIPGAAKELLEVMITSKDQAVVLGKVSGLATYAPLDLSDGEGTTKKISLSGRSTPLPAGTGVHTISHMSNPHGVSASQAFKQASAAYKRGKSDRLMGGAAAYYASVGHEHVKAAKASQAFEADALVARQSTSTTLDLHGINVSHAVRIAKGGTERWWDGLGDRKYVPVGGVGSGYKIVTGVGRHSADGIGRIGPAVSKMLVREGWKVEIGRGEIIVWGRARKK